MLACRSHFHQHPGLRERELFYWARMYTTQIARGDDYLELELTICIFILNFSESDSPRFHSILPVLKWGSFFRATTDEELEKLAMADPDMNAAKQALDRLSADPKAQQIAEDRELAIWNYKRTVKVSEVVRDRIQSANEAEVSRWTERVLSAPSVDAVFQN